MGFLVMSVFYYPVFWFIISIHSCGFGSFWVCCSLICLCLCPLVFSLDNSLLPCLFSLCCFLFMVSLMFCILCFSESAVFLNNLLCIWVWRLCGGGRVKFPLPPIAPFSPGGPGIPSCPWFPLGPDGPETPGGPVLPKYEDIIRAQWSVLRLKAIKTDSKVYIGTLLMYLWGQGDLDSQVFL